MVTFVPPFANVIPGMRLILISTPSYFVEEDKIITALFEEGLDTLHLRKPDTPPV